MTRDLLVSAYTPTLGTGGGVRTYGVARALAAGRPLDFLHVSFGASEPDAAYLAVPGLSLHAVAPTRGSRRALAYAQARLAGVPGNFAKGVSRELRRAAEGLAAEPERGRVVADGPIAAATLLPLARRRPVVYNAHNVESSFRHDFDTGLGTRETLAAFERRILEAASESWMASRRDMEAARRLAPAAALRYVPNVVDAAAIETVRPPGEGRILFVGDFTYQPNRDGLEFLERQVLPRVWKRRPDARLLVAGRGVDPDARRDPRVEVLGFVDDLATVYARADCVAVPLLAGGGSPLKFVEALAHALPVVATPAAAAGLDARADEHYREAGDAGAFAAALLDVLERGDPAVGAAGRALAESAYSIESLAGVLHP